MPTPIACSLDQAAMPQRLADWRDVVALVERREAIEGGVRLAFSPGVPLGRIAELAAAEQACCSFFAFAVTIDHRGTALEVRAPADGLAMVGALFGPMG